MPANTDNALTALPDDVFDGLTSLRELHLQNNQLTTLDDDVFEPLTALRDLHLQNNALATLPDGVFDGLTALSELHLQNNRLTTLDDDVFEPLTALSELHLQNNQLTTLPDDVFEPLTALMELYLQNNALATLPDGVFDGLTSLSELYLQDNQLTTLPDDVFEPLTALTTLYLRGNPGASFAPEAVALPDDGIVSAAGGMVTLDGSGSGGPWGTNVTYGWALTDPVSGVTVTFDDATNATPVVTIPALAKDTELTFTLTVTGRGGTDGIAPATDTATVTVDPGICGRTLQVRNALVALIPGFSHCAHVTTTHLAAITGVLRLTNNSIDRLAAGDFDGLTSLGVLGLNDNRLTTLPDGVFDGLTSLVDLYLQNNRLTTLDDDVFEPLTLLRDLLLEGNRLTTLPDGLFDSLTALVHLDLGSNQLTTFPDDMFEPLTSLQTLSLDFNELATLDAGVFDELTALTDLSLASNQLTTLPDDVFEPLTALTSLRLSGNPGAPFAPEAVALPDDGTVSAAGGMVTLDGSGSDGGPWGTNVTYGWALTDPVSGVTVTFDDDTSATTEVTIPALAEGTELTFTLTVTGRGGTNGIVPATDTGTVTAISDDATLSALTVNDGTNDLTLAPVFASGTFAYAADVAHAVDEVTLSATVNHAGAAVSAVTLTGTAVADGDFTDGITVSGLLVDGNEIVVTVTAEDTSTTRTYTVTVTRAANAAPTALAASVTTDEDTAYTFAAADFNFTDSDGDALASVTVVTLPTEGTLELDGTAVTTGQSVPAADIGKLVFTPAANAHGAGYASFTFRVHDGTDESASSYVMTVNVTAMNDPATGAPTISGTARVGETLTAATAGIADVDGLTSPSYGYQWIRVDADGTSNPTDITGATLATYTPVRADVGNKLRVKVSFTDDDGNGEELTSAPTATVLANTAPTALDASVTTNEDTAYTFGAADFNFDDSDGNALASVTVVTLPTEGSLTLDGPAVTAGQSVPAADIGKLVFTPAPNAHGDAHARFTFRVHDGTDESAAAYTMTVNVTAMNDPATGAPTIGGTAVVGQTLTAATLGIADVDGLTSPTYGYQWVRVDADGTSNPTDITGATSATYKQVEADVGRKLRVTVSFTDDDGNDEELTSAPTATETVLDPTVGICGRTPQVRDALVALIPGVSNCADVTATHLAAITGTLELSAQQITALAVGDFAEGDFAGLTSLTHLSLYSNALTTLPTGVFAELTALTELLLGSNQLSTLPDGVFDGLTRLETLALHNNALTMLDAGVFDGLTSLTSLNLHGTKLATLSDDVFKPLTALAELLLGGNSLTTLPAEVFNGLTSLTVLRLARNELTTLDAGVFDGLTSLTQLYLNNNELTTLDDDVFEPLTALIALTLRDNPGAPFAPEAVALPDDGTVPAAGGMVTLDGSGSDGGPWGTNVTYGWALTDPVSGVTVTFDDDTSATPEVTIPALTAGTGLTFTLTVTGRGGTDGIVPATDTATVTATASNDAKLSALTVNDGTSDLTLAPAFASGTFVYAADVATAVDEVTLSATVNHAGASVSAVTLNGTAVADGDFTDGITVSALLAGGNDIVVTVTAEDTSTTLTYTVTVTANTAPTAFDASVTTNEDTAYTFGAADFNFDDTDSGDALASVTVVTLPAEGTLELDGTAVMTGQSVPAADIGKLVFTPAANGNGDAYASFTFRVHDGTDESAAAYTMTVNVTAMNDSATGAPTISGTARVGQTLTAATAGIADVDGLTSPSYGYQWIRVDADGTSNPTDITGATSATYAPVRADVGNKLRVKVSFTDDDSNDEELTSDAYPASGTVEAAPNAAPSFMSPATFDAAENQTAVDTVAASDGDAGDGVTGYAIESGADASRFTIVEATGVLTFTSAPNFEAPADADTNNEYVVVVRATSGTGAREKTADQTITVTVTDEAGEAPGAPATPTVSTASVSSVTVAWAAPPNAGPPITDYDYRYRVKTPRGSWTEVTTTPIPGLSATIAGLAENTEYEVQVRATNAEGTGDWSDPPGSGATDANAAPSFTSPATFDAAENQTAVDTVAASDGDPGDGVTGYALQGGADASRFTIVEATGELAFTSAPNFEAPADADTNNEYVVVVRATSGTGAREKTADQTITVTVTDEDGEAPGAPATPTVSSASVSSVTVAWAAPPNAGPPITDYDYRYRMKTPQGSWTEVTSTPITALSTTIAGLAENTEYEVQVRATNAEGTGDWSDPPGSGATDANAAPSFMSPATFDAAENQTAVDTVAASDGDPGDGVTGYAIESGADQSRFTIVEATGELAFTSAPNFEAAADADTNNEYVVVVRATSGTGAREKTADQTITVTVTDEDGEAPGAPATPTVSSASVSSVTVAWAAPPNAGPPITDYDYRYRVKTPRGSWTEVTTTPITALSATITGLAENTEYEVQVRATNAEGTGDWSDPPGSGSTDANAAPSFTSPATFDAAENQTAVGTVAAADGDAGDGVTGYAIESGADASRFTIVEATGVLTFASAPNFEAPADADTNNDYVVVVRATSGTGAREKTADQTITVTVTDEDGEAPGAPATPTVSSASVSSVTVAWAAPPNAGPPITDYDYRYRVKTPRGPWTEVTTTPITGLSATITGLAENTEYDVQVRATNAEGTGDWSDPPGSGATDANAALPFTIAPASASEGDAVTFTVTLAAAATQAVTVDYATSVAASDTAAQTDFTAVSGTLTFAAGETQKTFTVGTVEDSIDESDETFTVTLDGVSPVGAATLPADPTATGTIIDDDNTPALSISVAPGTIAEAGGTSTVTVSTGTGSTFADDQTITLVVSGTATETADYDISSKSLTLPAGVGSGASSVTATVTAVDDNFYDGRDDDETIVIAGSRGGTAFGAQQTISILDDEDAPEFTLILTPASISESGGMSIVTGTLDTPIAEALTGTLETVPDPNADPPVVVGDYVISGSLTFAAHSTQSTGTLTVTAVDNRVDTDDKLLYLEWIPDLGYVKSGEADLIIEDDDAAPVLELSVNPETIAEAGGTSTVTVSTGAGSTFRDDQTITLVVSGTATETADYNISSKSLTLPAGVGSGASSVTATVTAVDDNFYDGRDDDETIVIAGSREGTAFGAQHTISILDDEDSPEFTLILTPASISESGGTSIVTGTLDTPIAEALTGTLGTFLDPNADPPVVAGDYVISGSLTFAAHSTQSTGTLTVTAVDNRVDTDDKLLDLEWITDLGYVKSGEAYLIIEDDDAAPVLELSVNPETIAEAGGTSAVTVSTGAGSTFRDDQTITLVVSGTATETADYNISSKSLTLPAGVGSGASSVTATVTAMDDALFEGGETVLIDATLGTGGMAPAAGTSLTLTIIDDDRHATGAPAITGTAQVGMVLTASPGSIADADGLTGVRYGYQWIRVDGVDEADIGAANAATYTPVPADVGKTLKVRASFTDDAGFDEQRTSDAYPASGTVEAVPNAAPSFTTAATFDAAENQTVVGTVAASDGDAGDGVTGYALQGGADASRFTIVEATGELAFTSAPNFEAPADADTDNDYVVVVRATSGTGARLKTADQTITVTVTDEDGEAPGAPATPTVSSASVTSVTVAWAAPPNAGPPITDYDYRYRVKTPRGSWTEVTTTPITALSTTIAGLAENTEYDVQVRATNAEGTGDWSDPPGSGATDANAAPSFTSAATFDAAENQTVVGTVAASDGDPGDGVTGYALQGGADASRFTIVEATGELAFTSAPNFEAPADADTDNEYVVVVRATSGTGARLKTADQTITVTVTDEAGEAPGAPATPTVSSASVSSVTVAWAVPPNAGPPITDYDYRYRVKTPRGPWTEVTSTPIPGLSTTITGLAENTEYEVQVRATNAEGTGDWSDPPGSGATDANAAPSFTSPATFDAAENQTVAGTVAASDGDAGDGVTGYAIESGADQSRFTIVEATGELTFTSAPNFEAPADADTDNDYVVVVRATSGTGAREKTADQTITVTVTDEDGEAPGAPATPTVSSASVSSVTVAWAAPPNAGPPITDYDYRYRVKTPRGPWTEVTSTPITVLSTTITGLAENTEYEVQVRATNAEGTGDWSDPPGSGSTGSTANNAPVFSDATLTRSMAENTAENMNIGAPIPAATDADGDSLTYSMEGTDAASFAFDASTRRIKTGAALDFESRDSYSVTVRADDGHGGAATIAVTINVADVDEPPDAPAAPSVSATPGSTTSLDVGWTAPRNSGRPAITSYDLQYRVGGGGSFTAGPRDVAGTSATITGLAENTAYQVRVRATNDEGDSDWSAPGTGRTDSTDGPSRPGNHEPEFPSGTVKRSVAENTPADSDIGAPIPAATDADGDSLTYSMEGTDAASFAFDASTRRIKTVAALDFESRDSYSVTVRADDGNGGADTIAVTINVTDVDEPPDAPAAPSVSATPGSTTSLDVGWTAPPNSGRPAITSYDLQYRVGGGGSFTAGPRDVAGTSATITGLAENTEYQVQVRATNDEGDSDWSAPGTGRTGRPSPPGNREPEFPSGTVKRSVAENTPADSDIGAPIPAATDADGDSPTYSMEGTDAASFAFDASTRRIKTVAALDFESGDRYSVTVRADDGNGGADTIAVTINVTDVDEPPDAPAAPSVSATPGSTTSLHVGWTAPPNSGRPAITSYDLQYRVGGGGSFTAGPRDVAGTSATITGLAENTEYQVQVRATNDEGDSDWSAPGTGRTGRPSPPGNREPEFPSGTVKRSVAENTPADSDIGAPIPAATDADGDSLTYSMGGTDAASFAFDASTRRIKTVAALDFESRDSYSVTVRADDGNGGADTIAVTINVTDVDEPPDAPAAPSVSATPGSASTLDVGWTAPPNSGRPAITSYDLQYRVGGGGSFTAGPRDVAGTSATITGLAENTAYQVQVRATNDEGDSDWSAPGMPVNNAPVFSDATLTRSMAENTAENMNIGAPIPAATDADGDSLTYSMEGTDAASFAFDASTRRIKTVAALDFESEDSYSVTVKAGDGRGGTATIAVTINVTDVDEPPDAPAAPSVSATPGSTTSLDVGWTAPRNSGRPAITSYDLQYRVGGGGSFTAGPRDVAGTSATITGLAENTAYQVQVRATNDEGDSDWSAPGTPVNNAPAFSDATLTRSIAENTAENMNIGAAIPAATDADGDSLTYSMEGTDAASFAFDASTRRIKTGAPLDFESRDSYSVTVRADDGNGGTATIAVTINVTDVGESVGGMSQGWLTRFGRTVSDNAVRAIEDRWRAERIVREPSHLTLGGWRVNSSLLGGDADRTGGAASRAERLLETVIRRGGQGGWKLPELRDLLQGSSFSYSGSLDRTGDQGAEGDEPWQWSVWGGVGRTRFDGVDGALPLDGDVSTGTLGADLHRGRWFTGVALSYSRGAGSYRREADEGGLSAELTSVHPFVRYELSERTSLWGVLGYGVGKFTPPAADSDSDLSRDLTTKMVAVGGRGVLSKATGGFELAIRSDARATATTADASAGLMDSSGLTSRVRLLLEGTGSRKLASGGVLSTTLDAGLRYDDGEAETGGGVEGGGGLMYASGRVVVQVNARALVAHEDEQYKEWGVSGSLLYRPRSDGNGLSLRLGPAWGATESGVQSLWSRQDARGLARGGMAMDAAQRFETELGYGLAGRKADARWYPYIALQAADGAGEMLTMGLKLISGPNVEAGLGFVRRDNGREAIEHTVKLSGSFRW